MDIPVYDKQAPFRLAPAINRTGIHRLPVARLMNRFFSASLPQYLPIKKRPCRSSFFGGGKRDRTADLLNAIQALSQLSYTPVNVF